MKKILNFICDLGKLILELPLGLIGAISEFLSDWFSYLTEIISTLIN